MSNPYGAQPPTSPPPSGPPPSGPPSSFAPPPSRGPRTRGPWIVAALASLVALAAVVALVVVVTGDDGGGSDGDTASDSAGGSQRGFDTPEAAVTFLVERLAAGEAGEAAEAYVVGPMVEGFDFEKQVTRLRAVTFSTWLPGSSDAYDEINEGVRRGEVAAELRSLVRSILAPERDLAQTTTLTDDLTAADLADELSPEPLADLSLTRVDQIDRSDAQYTDVLDSQAEAYGADELQAVAALLDTADGQVMGGATLARYDDQWAIMNMYAPILDIPFGQVVSASEDEYLDALASANGDDD